MAKFGIFFLGLFAGALIFWCGHQFWPQAESPERTVKPAPVTTAPLNLPHGALGEETIADIASNAVKSVVNIDTSMQFRLPTYSMQGTLPFEFFFGQNNEPFFNMPKERKFESHGTGSGIIIRPNGYILTNNHVVKDANEIKVTLSDKQVFTGKVVGRDKFTDLAIIKIEAQNLPTAKLGDSNSLRPGDWAIAIGSPLGLSHTVTLGIVSALGRSIQDLGNEVKLIQTDAAINPGNSGGPLLNIKGDVIGVNTAIRGDGQNIGFAIPIDLAMKVTNELLQTGSIKRAYVGIYMQQLDETLNKGLGLAADSKGVVVIKVSPDSPAAAADLKTGDVIQKVAGKSVANPQEVQERVREHKPGEKLALIVIRDGKLISKEITIGDYPAN